MERQVPLLTFFTLFGRMLATPSEVAACGKHFRQLRSTAALSYDKRQSASFVDMLSLRRRTIGSGSNTVTDWIKFDLTMPTSLAKSYKVRLPKFEERQRATECPALMEPADHNINTIALLEDDHI
jgi:hypothetical protein